MKVFDGDPIELEWRSHKGEGTILQGLLNRNKPLEDIALSGKTPPTDVEFEALLSAAKEVSIEKGDVFLVLQRLQYGEKVGFIPFAKYRKGKLVSFCRPPWRKGASLQ